MKKFVLLSLVLIFTSAALAQSGKFKPGHYYTKDGVKKEGLISFHFFGSNFQSDPDGECWAVFKENKQAEKQKLTTKDICCFVIEKDSFAILRNFTIGKSNAAKRDIDFVEVFETGKINMYGYHIQTYNGNSMSTRVQWITEKDGKPLPVDKKDFRDVMPEILNDYPELLARVTSKELRYDDLRVIIKTYNDHFREAPVSNP